MKEMSTRGVIGIKRMGELDSVVFQEACKRKYPEDVAEDKAAELCSLWDEYLRDPEWHPFKVVLVNGEHKVSHFYSLLFLSYIVDLCIFTCMQYICFCYSVICKTSQKLDFSIIFSLVFIFCISNIIFKQFLRLFSAIKIGHFAFQMSNLFFASGSN